MKSLFFIVLVGVGQASAKTLVVSDIDDTIKASHVLDKSESVKNVFKMKISFSGMAELYRGLEEELILQEEDPEFAYVSNAPKFFVGSFHKRFLRENLFPQNHNHFFRDNLKNDNFKVETIADLIRRIQPENVILIGDNGEADPTVYHEIKKMFPQLKFQIWIRLDYLLPKKPVFSDQNFFVHPAEIAFGLWADSWVSVSLLDPRRWSSSEDFVPSWVNCRSHQSPINPDFLPDNLYLDFSRLSERISDRCRGSSAESLPLENLPK